MRWSGLGQAIGDTDPREEGKARFGRRELRVLWPHLRPHMRLALGGGLLLVVAQAAALATPFLIRYGALPRTLPFRPRSCTRPR